MLARNYIVVVITNWTLVKDCMKVLWLRCLSLTRHTTLVIANCKCTVMLKGKNYFFTISKNEVKIPYSRIWKLEQNLDLPENVRGHSYPCLPLSTEWETDAFLRHMGIQNKLIIKLSNTITQLFSSSVWSCDLYGMSAIFSVYKGEG